MITTKKLLLTLIATVMLSICFGATAFASELDILSVTPKVTEDTDNSDNNIEGQSNETTLEDGISEENTSKEEQDQILEEGYFVDEQGQIYYEESSDDAQELVIEEVVEDAEEVEEVETVVKKSSYSEKDLRLLASLIYAEAGNQSYNGMLGVANIVINRMNSNVYWHVDTIKEVIYDRKWSVQFAVTVKNKKTGLSMLDKALKYYDTRKFSGSNPEAEKKALNKAIKAAKAALEGNNNIGDYLCFQNKRSASRIKAKYSNTKIVGDHIFYRTK